MRFAQEGDAVAREVWDEAVTYLGIGVAAVITILAPERVVIGGGVTKAGDFLFQPLAGGCSGSESNWFR